MFSFLEAISAKDSTRKYPKNFASKETRMSALIGDADACVSDYAALRHGSCWGLS